MRRGTARKYSSRKTYKIKKRKPIYRSKIFWVIFISATLVAGIVYLLIFSRYFWVSTVDVLGTQRINRASIVEEIERDIDNRLVFPSRSIFLFSTTEARNNLKKTHPAIEEVEITKKLPSLLAVTIRERSAIALWFSNQRFYQIDKYGIIFEEVAAGDRLIIRPKEDNVSVSIGGQVAKEDMMRIIIQIDQSMKQNSGLIVREAVIDNNEQITIITADGWSVFFGIKNDINWQLEKLKAVLEKQIPVDGRKELEYIDVRFGNLAPYRYRDKQ
ncbi:MAG: cell division protein FtsQ/DivIB [bacterium]